MDWTHEQKEAIETRGGKIIVSAGAGSGKTAVLSNRIITYIIKGGSLDKLLIVTFTVLAASEMRERIKKNIEEALKDDPKNIHLQNQQLLVEQALIMTMDAFYSKLIKENFMYLNINPNFQIISELEYGIIKRECSKEVVKELLDKDDSIIKLLDNFSNYKMGTTIEEILILFNDFVNKIPFPDKFLSSLLDIYKEDRFNNIPAKEILYKSLTKDFYSFSKMYEDILEELKGDDHLYKYLYNFALDEQKGFEHLLISLENNDLRSIIKIITSWTFKKYPSIRGYANHPLSLKFKALRDEFKEVLKQYVTLLSYYNTFSADQKQTEELLTMLIYVLKKYRLKLEEIKTQKNFYAFDDIPPLVLNLLIEDYNYQTGQYTKTELAKQLTTYFAEILIDEYQDTNLMQDLIFRVLSKDNTNLFIVGDVKQSIYGFRSSRPDLFIKEYQTASLVSFPRLINLAKNFRSRKEILDFINYLFSKIMSFDLFKTNYDEKERLYLGANYDNNPNSYPELYFLTNLKKGMSKEEQESILLVTKIKELFSSNYQVYDSNLKATRSIKESDIAILVRSMGPFVNTLRDVLINSGFNVYTNKTLIYFDNYEIKLIISLLKVINNPYDDISLTAVLRSPLFLIETGLLYEIRKINYKNKLYDNLQLMTNNSLINNFLLKLKDYQEQAKRLTIDELLIYIYNDTKIMALMSSKYGHSKIKNLLEMINHAHNFLHNKTSDLYDFILYIDTLIANKYSLEGQNPSPINDSILITTIHQSKGLEFPVVIIPEIDKKFNFKDLTNDMLLDDDYFVAFKLRDQTKYITKSNLLFELIKIEKRNKQLAEELRILYVALTRAKEKLILIGLIDNLEGKIQRVNSLMDPGEVISNYYLKQSRSFLDWLLPVVIKHHSSKELRDLANITTNTFNDETNFKTEIIDCQELNPLERQFSKEELNPINLEEITNVLSYNYPIINNKQKINISVSELKIKYETLLKPNFVDGGIQLIVGNIYHKVLEFIAFKDYNYESFQQEINFLMTTNKLTKEEIEAINLAKVYNFFKDPLYKIILNNKTIKKEYPIFFLNEEEIIVDGIIDLFFEYNNEYYIIDYKSDIVNNEEELIEKYKDQLDLYEKALNNKIKKKIKKYIYSFYLSKYIEIT